MPVANAAITAAFDRLADLLDIGGINSSMGRARRRAARLVEALLRPLTALRAVLWRG